MDSRPRQEHREESPRLPVQQESVKSPTAIQVDLSEICIKVMCRRRLPLSGKCKANMHSCGSCRWHRIPNRRHKDVSFWMSYSIDLGWVGTLIDDYSDELYNSIDSLNLIDYDRLFGIH